MPLEVIGEPVLLEVPVTPAPSATFDGANQDTLKVRAESVLLEVLAALDQGLAVLMPLNLLTLLALLEVLTLLMLLEVLVALVSLKGLAPLMLLKVLAAPVLTEFCRMGCTADGGLQANSG